VRDGCSRRVNGYAFADRLHTDLVETALRCAVTFRDPDTGSRGGVISTLKAEFDRRHTFTTHEQASRAVTQRPPRPLNRCPRVGVNPS